MKKYKIELTEEELKALIYHTEYDIDTIGENHNWKEIERDEDTSHNALKKLFLALYPIKGQNTNQFCTLCKFNENTNKTK